MLSASTQKTSSSTTSTSTTSMGGIISFLFGVGVGVVGTGIFLVVGALYGAQHVERVVKEKLEKADKEQRALIVSSVATRGESMVYPLEGIVTQPPLHGVADSNLCLRLNRTTVSVYQPENNSPKSRSANVMQVLAQFDAAKIILHQITPRRIEIEAQQDGKTPVARVTFSTLHVEAVRITLNFAYRHEASEVYSRLVACGAGVTGNSVFLTRALRHVPEYYGFLAGLPQQRISAATILLARVLGASNDVKALKPFILSKLVKKISKIDLPAPVRGKLEVAGITLGKNSPAVGEIRVVNSPLQANDGSVELAVDIDYSGGLEVSLNADVKVDTFFSVTLPSVTVTVKVLKLQGVLRVLFLPPPAKEFWISFETTPDLKLGFAQRVNGGNAVVKAVSNHIPDLSGIITDVVRNGILDDMVLPNRDDVPMPILGDTPPATPAEPENDASVFDKFRHSHYRFGTSAASPGSAGSGPAASPAFGSPVAAAAGAASGSRASSPKNDRDDEDDVISSYSAAPLAASMPKTNHGQPPQHTECPPAVGKKTIQIAAGDMSSLKQMTKSVDADAAKKKQEQEEAEKKKAADEEAAKKRSKSPTFFEKAKSRIAEAIHKDEAPATVAAAAAPVVDNKTVAVDSAAEKKKAADEEAAKRRSKSPTFFEKARSKIAEVMHKDEAPPAAAVVDNKTVGAAAEEKKQPAAAEPVPLKPAWSSGPTDFKPAVESTTPQKTDEATAAAAAAGSPARSLPSPAAPAAALPAPAPAPAPVAAEPVAAIPQQQQQQLYTIPAAPPAANLQPQW